MKTRHLSLFYLHFLAMLGLSTLTIAQSDYSLQEICGTEYVPMSTSDVSEYVSAMQSSYRHGSTDSVIIPLVIHNLTWNSLNYISDKDFIDIVAKVNDRLANRGEYHDPLGIDTRIRVCLANVDPEGNPSSGIHHVEDPEVLDGGQYINRNLIWDIDRYLNAFIYDGALGFGAYPWSFDGGGYMMINSQRTRTPIGITTWVHEIGHTLGLLHTYEGCAVTQCLERGDMVCDTPPDQVSFSGCMDMDSCLNDDDPDDPDGYFEGNSKDMVENYMDGGFCRTRFTKGQVARMHWALQMYKPDWDGQGTLCKSCPTINADFSFDKDNIVVNEPLSIAVDEIAPNGYNYTWYVDNESRSNETVWMTSFGQAGVYRLRLEVSPTDGACQNIMQSSEQVISVRCEEDESLRIHLPERMIQDSCYRISIQGVTELSWEYDEQSGTSDTILLCPSTSGLQSIKIHYGSGACSSTEDLHFMVYADMERERSYFHQRMRFERDTNSSQDFMKLYEVGEDSYRMIGTENYAKMNFQQDTHQNFIRTWYPFEQEGYDWELYMEDTITQRPESEYITELQLNFFDILEDTLDGSKYFLGLEHYAARRSSVYVLGKLNVFGKPTWTKRIHLPDYPFYEGTLNNNKSLHFKGDTLLMNLNQILCKLDKKGNVIQSVGLNRTPVGLYDRPMNSNQLGMVVKQDNIMFAQLPTLIDTSLYPTHTDSIKNIEMLSFWSGVMSNNFDLESSMFFDYDPIDSYVVRNTLSSLDFKEGSMVYWYQGLIGLGSIHLLYINKQNVIERYKIIADIELRMVANTKPNVEILNNDDILLSIPLDRGRKLAMYRLDSEWKNVESFGYEIPFDPTIFETDPNGLFSDMLRGGKATVLTHDGILANYTTSGGAHQDVHNFYLLPLDSSLLTCERFTPTFTFKDGTLKKHKLQPGVEVVPTRVEMEDIYLQRRVRTFTSDVLCENKYALEDYRIAILDTICSPSGTAEIKIEVCRDDTVLPIAVSLDLYSASPLIQNVNPFAEEEINFEQGQRCVQRTFFVQEENVHMLLNGNAEIKGPYTLSKTFFDGHEEMEYDYRNNFVFVEACENIVSTTERVEEELSIRIYPNPTKDDFHIESSEDIHALEIYSMDGQLKYATQSATNIKSVNVNGIPPSIYIIQLWNKAKTKFSTQKIIIHP